MSKRCVALCGVLYFGLVTLMGVALAASPPAGNCGGWVINGCFESGELTPWHAAGELPSVVVDGRSEYAYDGTFSLRLGEVVQWKTPPVVLPKSSAVVTQNVTIPATWTHPVLSFWYVIRTHDIIGWSSFYVCLVDLGEGGDDAGETREPTAVSDLPMRCRKDTADMDPRVTLILQDGFDPPDRIPVPYQKVGPRRKLFDLSPFKGHTVTLWFEAANEWDMQSYGIWVYLDDVIVMDRAYQLDLPILMVRARSALQSASVPSY